MKIIYLSAALALIAAPALAQDHPERGGNPSQATGHPNANVPHGGGGMRGPAAPQGNAPAMQHMDRGGEHRGTTQQAAPAAPAMQHNSGGNDRGRQDNNRQDNSHRGGSFNNNRSDNNRSDNSRGSDNNRFDNNRRGTDFNRGGNRARDFNSFHRNFASPRRYNAPRYRRPSGWYAHRWTYGERLPPAFFVRDYWIDDFFDYGLVSPPYGTTWVRYGSDALLIDEESGEVIQVVYGVFY